MCANLTSRTAFSISIIDGCDSGLGADPQRAAQSQSLGGFAHNQSLTHATSLSDRLCVLKLVGVSNVRLKNTRVRSAGYHLVFNELTMVSLETLGTTLAGPA